MRLFSRFVDSNDRELKRIQPLVDEINRLEPEFEAMTDEQIRSQFDDIRTEIHEIAAPDEPSEDELHHPDIERFGVRQHELRCLRHRWVRAPVGERQSRNLPRSARPAAL